MDDNQTNPEVPKQDVTPVDLAHPGAEKEMPQDSLPQEQTTGDTHAMLRTIKRAVLLLLGLAVLAAAYFAYQALKPQGGSQPQPSSSGGGTAYPAPAADTGEPGPGAGNTVSCISTTGPDATTASQQFVDIEGTECSYRSGPTEETLVLNGKLTGRNTEGTGMAVTINVNGKDCSGGETLNYSRTYTPMVSNCVFNVPANASVAIKWRFLSPFGGTAAVLRSSKNIAPSITGVAIPRSTDRR